MKNADLLISSEKEYFLNLYETCAISYVMVEADSVIFKEDEMPRFFVSKENPEENLEKVLQIRKITNTILERLKFNYIVECYQNDDDEVKISLEFIE